KRRAERRIGATGLGARRLGTLWGCALASALVALGLKLAMARQLGAAPAPTQWEGHALAAPALPPALTGILVLGTFGLLYFTLCALLGVPESEIVWRRVKRR